jgi:hypothetical protein
MTKLLNALKRTLGDAQYAEPAPHFHAGASDHYPEVCFEDACARPRLTA